MKSAFLPILFNQRSVENLETINQEFYLDNFLCNIIVHIKTKYRKDQLKTEGAFMIWKKGWWTIRWTDGQMANGQHGIG